jgi:hypothetical protein
MKHFSEMELIAYRDGDVKEREAVRAHLAECAECRAELAAIEEVFAALDAVPVPEPGEDYGQRVWRQVAPRLPEKRPAWWTGFLTLRHVGAFGAVAAVVVLAFYLGRMTTKTNKPGTGDVANAGAVRERVLVVAVGEHLGKSEMVLMELANAPEPQGGKKLINISAEQRRAEDLVEENRLYRQTAWSEGDKSMASTLDELERTLQDIANSPDEVTPEQFAALQKRIEARGLLLKVRVVREELHDRQGKTNGAPSVTDPAAAAKDRSKT